MSTTFYEIPMMVIPGVGPISRMCHGTTQKGTKCRMTGPWDWTPDDGPWYCHAHKAQG